MNSNFRETTKACQKECFGKCAQLADAKWFNTVKTLYDKKQSDLKDSWINFSTQDKDQVIRSKLYSELRKCDLKDVNDRISLVYVESFEDGRKMALCEDCFVSLYNHKGKRTYEGWKAGMKRSLLVDSTGADIQYQLSKKRRQTNW